MRIFPDFDRAALTQAAKIRPDRLRAITAVLANIGAYTAQVDGDTLYLYPPGVNLPRE